MASERQKCHHSEGEESASIFVLPEDALVNILLRLSVPSLLRCRCVCKSLYSLISDPIFKSNHRTHVAACRKIIIRRCDVRTRNIRYSHHSDDASLTEIAELGFSSPNPSNFSRILGSVNGLICLMNSNVSLMIWNPTIRKYLIIPIPNVDNSNNFLGFGFDPLADDYKIVRVVYLLSGSCAEVYRLNSRSWSRVNLGEMETNLPRLLPRQAYLNGVVHWLAVDSTIVGFDLRTETFSVINLPGDLKDKRIEDVAIAAWCGLLALFESENSRSICLWVMNEYGNAESWTRQCVISGLLFPKRVRGIASNGEILFEDCFGLLSWFDPATRLTRALIIQDIGDLDMFHAKAYTESLVLLDDKFSLDSSMLTRA